LTDLYETSPLLQQYLDFHFRGGDSDYLPHHPLPEGVLAYPERCAEKVIQHSTRTALALDLGCAVGGSTFALAKSFDDVVGIDFSTSFIDTASHLADKGVFRLSEEEYRLSSGVRKNRVTFQQGDACHLPEHLGTFDAILMANLLCRLPDPAACLDGLKSKTTSGSVLVFMTPCSWDEAYTPREKWLWPTEEALHEHLDPWCDCLETSDMPFVLRDHERRAQFTVALCTVWRVK
jgi:putative 4-mercaptohistidine N1-methyltranferase